MLGNFIRKTEAMESRNLVMTINWNLKHIDDQNRNPMLESAHARISQVVTSNAKLKQFGTNQTLHNISFGIQLKHAMEQLCGNQTFSMFTKALELQIQRAII